MAEVVVNLCPAHSTQSQVAVKIKSHRTTQLFERNPRVGGAPCPHRWLVPLLLPTVDRSRPKLLKSPHRFPIAQDVRCHGEIITCHRKRSLSSCPENRPSTRVPRTTPPTSEKRATVLAFPIPLIGRSRDFRRTHRIDKAEYRYRRPPGISASRSAVAAPAVGVPRRCRLK